ncbi:DUF3866 family protein [Arsenicicoccus dermatophilus]|uniref:DUF3866 family protein n=1 Tax=Arsenicicoccus dermatophilus TaxID=1076331 RepID=UPI001F4C75A7|nr:DUF3866 family protein [Arsenicicoccus dermatophilus]
MIRWRTAVVDAVRAEWPGAVEYAVTVFDDTGYDASACQVVALGYSSVVGRAEPGDRVLLNVSALQRGLGTGGMALVVGIPDRLPPDPPAGPGHVVKARYTPTQTMLLGVDEQESPHHALLAEADSVDGMPVVVADLHSALPAVVAGIRATRPGARVAYVMTDGGALPATFSRTVAGLREAGWLTACLTTGQAYGGDHEAVTVHTGLLAARLVEHADVAVVAQGPGNLGTGTRWGFSGVSAGEAVNAAHVLGGRAVASLRVSEGDARERHQGVSHHSLTAYGRVAMAPADVPVPVEDSAVARQVRCQAQELCVGSGGRLTLHEVPVDGLDEALATCPVPLRTMGRGLREDRAAFVAAAVAGRHAATLSERASNPTG